MPGAPVFQCSASPPTQPKRKNAGTKDARTSRARCPVSFQEIPCLNEFRKRKGHLFPYPCVFFRAPPPAQKKAESKQTDMVVFVGFPSSPPTKNVSSKKARATHALRMGSSPTFPRPSGTTPRWPRAAPSRSAWRSRRGTQGPGLWLLSKIRKLPFLVGLSLIHADLLKRTFVFSLVV